MCICSKDPGTFSTVCDDMVGLSDAFVSGMNDDPKRPLKKQDSGFHTMPLKNSDCTYEMLELRSKRRDVKHMRQRIPNGDVYTRQLCDSDVENELLLEQDYSKHSDCLYKETLSTTGSCRHLSTNSDTMNLDPVDRTNSNKHRNVRTLQDPFVSHPGHSNEYPWAVNMCNRSSSARSSRVYDSDLLTPESITQSSKFNSAWAISSSCDQ